MSSIESDEDSICDCESSEASSEHYFDIEVEDDEGSDHEADVRSESSGEIAYADEPLADKEWLKRYEEEKKENERLEKELRERLNGTVQVETWCSCGNCKRESLQNLSECYCCQELDGCTESMTSDLVREDVPSGETLKCVTQHPGFNAVCLQKWSLRMAGERVRTNDKKKYTQTGSEDRFLRSVAYREFSRLVYGLLGNKRIPLPACAYSAIRKQFPNGDDETFRGFQLDEDL